MRTMLTLMVICALPLAVYPDGELTHEYLQNGQWQSGDGFTSLRFSQKDGEYVFHWFGYEEGASGTYRITGDAVVFSGQEGDAVKLWRDRRAVLFNSRSGFYFTEGLEFAKGEVMWNTKTVVPPGAERVYKNIPVILIKSKDIPMTGSKSGQARLPATGRSDSRILQTMPAVEALKKSTAMCPRALN